MSRRMFSTEIVNSDPFLEMPGSTQALYFHLGMHCDDDGFVYPKKIMRMITASEDDLKILLGKKFLIAFDSGVMVQKHWNVNNYIRGDRYRATTHRDEIASLSTDKSGVYSRSTIGIPSGSISKEVSKKERREISSKETELNEEQRDAKLSEVRQNLKHKLILP